MRLVEKYRPMSLADIAGQPEALKKLSAYMPDNMGGRVFLLAGPSGTGKTTLAMVIGRELCAISASETLASIQKGANLDVRFWRGAEVDGKGAPEMADWAAYWPIGDYKMAIIDEAQNITPAGEQALLSIFEGLPDHMVVVMTTTGLKKVARQTDLFDVPKESPFGSRCKIVRFTEPLAKDVTRRLGEIEHAETGHTDLATCAKIVKQAKGNIRAAIDLLEDHIMERKAA